MAELVILNDEVGRRFVELLKQESTLHCRVKQATASTGPQLVLEAHPCLIIDRELWNRAYGSGVEGEEDASLDVAWETWPEEIRGHILRFDDEVLTIADTA